MTTGSDAAQCEHKPLLRPVVGLAEGLSKKDLEHITVEAIRTHRRLRDEAEALDAPYVENRKAGDKTVDSARLVWISAMMNMHAHQALVSTLLDVLGFIPDVPIKQPIATQFKSA